MTESEIDSLTESLRDMIDLRAGRIQRWCDAEFESLRRSIGQWTRLDNFHRKMGKRKEAKS